MNSSLPERLKIATRQLHATAERSTFMSALLRGEMTIASYRALLINLQAIYVALESQLERHCAHPAIAALWLNGIARAPALAHDLDALRFGASGLDAGLRPSTLAYVDRLQAIGAQDDPVPLVAHAYVRYLGDLSGGQILRRIVGEKMHAPTAFYEFGSELQAQALRAAFRQGLERLQLADQETDAVVAEAVTAFERHVALFEELRAAAAPPSIG